MKLSYSQISCYKTCPMQYRLRYVEGRETPPNASLSFGKSVHAALEWLYSVPTPHPATLEELTDYLEECWIPEGFASPEEEARYFFQARSTLELYYRRNVLETDEPFRIPAGLEHKFRVDLGFCALSGVIDRLDRSPEGAFEIIDYKTNRRLPPISRLRQDLQLPIYQIAAKKIWDVPVARVTFHYLIHDQKVSFIISPERESEALSEIERVSGCIDRCEFDPEKNNLCPWCDFLDECALMRGTPSRKGSVAAPPLEIGQAVDEYITATHRLENATTRLDGLRSIITSYLESGQALHVSGSLGTASLEENGVLLIEP
ncbi:MAG: PD-(D/E)XK nuclease family protein [Actinobacteria bacterium]|nr:PD-(D/E)XK nuclease family protein [Actinomycetota bacterium]MBU1944661.1 PD-(D/E)XK nuclease family protein [Actinomycetota bacterium]MBU2689209.1 PD-(D/E)XK nuclease family protein [Actinomycetota bacterium]